MLAHVAPTILGLKSYGEFDILYQYVNEEPALVIRASRFLKQRRRAWVITQESAWKYVDTETGEHSQYMHKATSVIATMLGLGTDINTRFRIAEAILSNLEELINMRPYKRPDEAIAAEVQGTMRIGSESYSIEAEIDKKINAIEDIAPRQGDEPMG